MVDKDSFSGLCLPLRKFALFLFLLLSVVTLQAQKDGIDWPEKMIGYYLQKQPEKCIFLADQIMAHHSGDYTYREAAALICAVYVYRDVDPQKSSQIATIICKPLVEGLIDGEKHFVSMSKEQKKKYIETNVKFYSLVMALCAMSGDTDRAIVMLNYFHNNIFANRNVFDSSIPKDADIIATIIHVESGFLMVYKKCDELLNLCHELLSLKKDRDPRMDYHIYNTFTYSKNEIIEWGFTEQGKQYLRERADFLLQYNDLCLNQLGYKAARNYNTITWQDVKNSLSMDECAVIMYEYNLLSETSINLIGGIVISPQQEQPEDFGIHYDSASPDEFIKALETKFPACKRFYICPIGKWENVDVAYTNSKVYMKYSLYDLVRYPKSLKYNGGMISLFANMDYGDITVNQKKVEPLNDGGKIINGIENLFGDKVYSLSGKIVKRINFLNVIDDVSIFHVSTHGMKNTFSSDVSLKSREDAYGLWDGNVPLMNFGLALSGFNEDNTANFVSAKDVKEKLKFTGGQLVYLDACETGETKEVLWGITGLAKVFYFAGARNVIAYNIEVKEKVATDFALSFYNELKESPSSSYHDIFYRVKERIIEKYKKTDYLGTDKYGRLDLGILLWE